MRYHLPIVAALAALSMLSPAVPAEVPKAFEGMRLFTSYCLLCHGPGGKGDGPLARRMHIQPADLTTTVRSRSDTVLKAIISGKGRDIVSGRDRHNLISDAMPEWKDVFSDEQVDALIAYLRLLSTSKHRLMGDPEAGYRLYQHYCVACHGEEGSGDGVMTRLIHMKPADHSNPIEMDRIDNARMVSSILDGAGDYMPAWRGILSQSEVESLVSYIRLLAQ